MGILNITPDSFSDGGRYLSIEHALNQAQKMQAAGADIIDIGGESTRPGAVKITIADEAARVIPVIQALRDTTDAQLSIDTSKPEIMQLAVEAGATLINDVRALQAPGALEVAADLGVEICLMHMQNNPQTMQTQPIYQDVVADISQFFTRRISACAAAGIDNHKIMLDPGFGFGKNLTHNLQILRRFAEFKKLGCRLMAGLSNKSMIGEMLNGRAIEGRQIGSAVAAVLAVQRGASVVRVHNVRATKDALKILTEVENG